MGVLAIEAMEPVVEPDSPYRAGTALPSADDSRPVAGLVERFTGQDPAGLAMLDAARPTIADLALLALDGLGPPRGPESLLLVQQAHDQEHLAMPLPRISQEAPWEFTEDLALSHLEASGGTAAFEFLGWALPEGGRATLVVADRPEFGHREAPPSGAVVAIRVVRGEGPLRVVDAGASRPPRADRAFTGVGPCRAWVALARESAAGGSVPGERLLVRCAPDDGGTGDWLLLEVAGRAEPGAAPVGAR